MSVDELMKMKEMPKPKQISKIVLTGGPCAGKTTAMSWIKNEFTKRGYGVLIVPETATELITGGVCPWNCESNMRYQTFQFRLQMEKERIFEEAAAGMKDQKILIVCDRGLLDNKAYMDDLEFACVLNELKRSVWNSGTDTTRFSISSRRQKVRKVFTRRQIIPPARRARSRRQRWMTN